ncbi:hypothetical protein BD289DRAFT_432125 [Coniella lustricola]|uniref:Uncharacterized protein n=1 Tax=Coniella lustricola TaxID=2025994 RepID=A0A2T3A9Z9_9PEZI|nr:hypothetical protein BD289DRAFT_432125 [Coniella lustricola]
MVVLSKLLTAATILTSTLIQAIPAPKITPALDSRAEATDAWVSVDKTGQPTTVTPVVTVSEGSPTTISAIPTVLTATVLTRTAYGELTTSSGTAAAQPTASNKKGQGAFLVCSNADGDYAPFCEPAKNSSLYTGTTYFVTWDSSVLNSTEVTIKGTYLNSTTGEAGDDAFTSDPIRNTWSYYAWTPGNGYLSKGNGKAVNVTLTINALDADGETVTTTYPGPTVLVTKRPTYHQAAPSLPTGAALYIGLPVVFGFCLIMICGVCMWNRHTRRIDVATLVSRSRRGYRGAKDRAKRMTTSGRKQRRLQHNIRLLDNVPENQMYRDEPRKLNNNTSLRGDYDYDADARDIKMGSGGGVRAHVRRDSDGLGSLAGTPTSEHFPRQQQQGGNAFREEMERQRRERE